MLRSSSCWFEFYSVITERERDRDRETGAREERQGKRKWGKEKEKGERGKETGREEREATVVISHAQGGASPGSITDAPQPRPRPLLLGYRALGRSATQWHREAEARLFGHGGLCLVWFSRQAGR